MPLRALNPVDTRSMFRPVSAALVTVLRALSSDDWERPTVAGTWVVRDIVAHLLDITLRRLSFHRDRMPPPPPEMTIASERDFVDFINGLNAAWVRSAKRMSPLVLTDLYERAAGEHAAWFESLPLEAPALFPVSWAGETHSEGWFDIGREFVELWHHQQQIRMAVGAEPLSDGRYLRAALDVSIRGLPHAFRDAAAAPGDTVLVDVAGSSGGQWTLTRETDRWSLSAGEAASATTRVRLDDDVAWKLLCNALPPAEATRVIHVEGLTELATPLFRARSVIV